MKRLVFLFLFAFMPLIFASCSGGGGGGGGGGIGDDGYTVVYYDGTVSQREVSPGAVIDLPVPVKTGYQFAGWLEYNTGTPKIGRYTVTGDVVFFASWIPLEISSPTQYILVFYNGSAPILGSTVTANSGATVNLPTFSPPAGYTFAGWLKENSGSPLNGSYYVTGNAVFYAALTPQNPSAPDIYNITFYDGDNFLASVTLTAEDGEEITLPSYSKPGYTFNGWKLNNAGSVLNGGWIVNNNTKFYADLTLTGTPVTERTIRYYDGVNLLYTVYAADGSVIALPNRAKTDYTFNGWKENGLGEPKKGNYTVNANVDFHADWTFTGVTPSDYTVQFYNNNILQESLTRIVPAGTDITLPPMSQSGLIFNGWLLNNEEPARIGVVTVNGDMVFHAKWTPDSAVLYTANFYDGGVLVPEYTITVETSRYITLPSPVKSGYTFNGWYTDNAGSSYSAGYRYYTLDQNRNIYAKWTPVDPSVAKLKAVFYDDGIQTSVIEDYAVNAITLSALTRNGYTFNGWKVGATANIVNGIYVISADTDFTSDFTLNAPIVEIRTPAQLADINANLDRHYRLMEDIDLSGYSAGIGWTPIGSLSFPFTGVFEGNGKKIYNLAINDPSNDYVGLFGYISNGARIADLTVELADAGITGKTNAGGITGYARSDSSGNSVKIVNSHTKKSGTGGITVAGSSNASVGGIVGYAYNYVTIIGSSNEVAVNSSYNAGGIAGYSNSAYSSIYNSWNTGAVTSTSGNYAYVGGILGRGNTFITQSHNTGAVNATGDSSYTAYAGGINGYGNNITDSYNTGSVSANTGETNAGGISGYSQSDYNMIRNYNSGAVSAVSSSYYSACAGGIVGQLYNSNTSVLNSYNTGAVSATTNAASSSYHPYAGGIVGYQNYSYGNATISGNYNTGDVIAASAGTSTGAVYSGGIVGYQYGTVSGNYNTGDITATSASTGTVYAAGIVGYMNGSRTITNNAAANSNVTGTSSGTVTINRILAFIYSGTPTMQYNFALDTMSATGAAFGSTPQLRGTDKTETALKTLSTYSADTSDGGLGWKFGNDDESPWKMPVPNGSGYPRLYWQTD